MPKTENVVPALQKPCGAIKVFLWRNVSDQHWFYRRELIWVHFMLIILAAAWLAR